MYGGSLSVYDRQGRSGITCVGTYARRTRAVSRSCPVAFLIMPDFNMPLLRHATEFEYVCRMNEIERTDISSDSNVVDLSRCCFPSSISSIYLLQKLFTWSQDADF